MASAVADDNSTVPAPASPTKGKRKLLLIIGGLLLTAALSAGSVLFLKRGAAGAPGAHEEAGAHGEQGHSVPKAAALYLALDPAFVVNLEDQDALRFLQIEVQIMARDPSALEAVSAHMPHIRNSLLMLFGQQHVQDIATRAGKERLRGETLAEVRKVLQEETGKTGIEAVYFTSFVMQ
jgi:flagellar FliL protein